MRVLIIEDEIFAARQLINLLEEINPAIKIEHCFDSIDASVRWLKDQPQLDLIFMDIQLSDGLSFEIFKLVDIKCPVIFTTAYDEYALQAFKVNSIDYLLKPVNKEDLAKSLQKWECLKHQFSGTIDDSAVETLLEYMSKGQQQYKSRFLIKSGQIYSSIPVDNIAYFYSDRKLTFLLTFDGKKSIIDESLDKLEEQLDPDRFFRLNRAFLANLDSIVNVHAFFNGKLKINLRPSILKKNVLVSREKATPFKQWLDK